MIKQNIFKLIASSVIILFPVFFSGISKTFLVMPLILLLIQWTCIFITLKDNESNGQNKKIFSLVIFIIPFISLFSTTLFFCAVKGKNMYLLTHVIIGAFFALIGNYLPKCKQNFTIGIKIRWTLANEENWNATHRFSGKIWLVGGLIMMASVFLPKSVIPFVFYILFPVMIIVPILYSFVYYKKQVKEGKAPEKAVVDYKKYKGFSKVGLTVAIVVVILALALMFTGNIEISVSDSSITIEANYWEDTEIPYEAINSIEYRETDNKGVRTYGFGSAKLLMGVFSNEEFGSYTRYSYTGSNSCIVIETEDEIFVISGKNTEDTQNLYGLILKNK